MFEITEIKLGVLKAGEYVILEYPYNNLVDIIMKITSSCDCGEAHNNIEKRAVILRYRPNGVPIHLRQKGQNHYDFAKEIKVEYTTKANPGITEIIGLRFIGKVVG